MSKITKNDLASIYKLEFYKSKKKWIIPSKASKGRKKDKKQLEKKTSENEDSKNSRDPDLVIDEQEVRDLNKTYSVETVNNKSTWNEAFIESGSGLDTAIDNEDADSTESPQLIIERTEPVVNYKVFWPQLMLTGITNDTEVLDSNFCFNPYDYQDGDFIKNINKINKTNEYNVDVNANIENKTQDVDVNENSARHYDNGDHEFVNENRFVKNRKVIVNDGNENDLEKEIDNIFVKRNLDPQSISNNCLFQYGNVVTNEGMYYKNGYGNEYGNGNGFYAKQEPKIVTDENYLQNVLMQINNEVTSAEGRVLDELGSCSSLNTLRFMEGARHAPHSSEIDLYDITKEQMWLSDRSAMEKYNETIHEDQLLAHKLNKKLQKADSYLWNNINNGVPQEMSQVHRPPTVTTINDSTINVEATNQLSKMLLYGNTDNHHDISDKHDNPDVTIVTNKRDITFNGNQTLVYKKIPKIAFANQSANECYDNLKNYPMPCDVFDGNFQGYASSVKTRSIYNDDDPDEDCSSKNMFMYINNANNTPNVNSPTFDFSKCLPKLNSAPSSVSGQLRKSNNYPQTSNVYPQNSNNYPKNSNNYSQNSNHCPQNSTNFPQNSNNYPQNSEKYPQSSNNYPQYPDKFPQTSNNYPQNYNNNQRYSNNSPKFETDVAPYYVNNEVNLGSRSNSVYSENTRTQCQRVITNSKIPIPSLNIPLPNLNNTAPNLNTTAAILNSPPPKLDLPLPNFNIPPPNLIRRCSHENFDPVLKNSVSYVDVRGVNFRWSMNSAPADYFESLHHPLVHGPPNAPCFLNVENLPKSRGRGRLMKS